MTPSRYFACLYSPEPAKGVLEALCSLETEINSSLRPGLDHQVAHSRLQWWRDECERTIEGRPAHPVTRQLLAVARHGASFAELAGFVDVATWDLANATFATRRELAAYCERWARAMLTPLADTSSRQSVMALGVSLHELELLDRFAEDARRGRLRLPLDELACRDIDPLSAATPTEWPDSLASLLSERRRTLRALLAKSAAALEIGEQTQLRGLLVWCALAWRRSQHDPRRGAERGRLESLRDAWSAWRAARGAQSGRFQLGSSE
ncbi:MAG TPA: squalene/phytoene synthase family protein [Steroidobacteraceae bacterium]|nr:squalene/phytoene synthase family protein [Steroidobacteraceae bacterium]